jgi:hypothetical protein
MLQLHHTEQRVTFSKDNTTQHNTTQHNTTQHNATQHNIQTFLCPWTARGQDEYSILATHIDLSKVIP